MQVPALLDSNLELGLVLIGSLTVAVLMLLLCTCLKQKKGVDVSDERKNGHLFGSGRRSNIGVDTEFDDEGLRGARATSHRRLPDIPDPLLDGPNGALARNSSVRSSQDNSSELYAQVEIGGAAVSFPVNPKPNEDPEAALRCNGAAAAFVLSEGTASGAHPYDKVKSNHGYSKIKKKAENPYAKVKRTDTMESETAEADENETDTDNYDVVDTLHTVDETGGKSKPAESSAAVPGTSDSVASALLLPPPLPLPLRGSHSSLASGGESGSHGPRPPPRTSRRISGIALSHSGSRPGSMALSEHDARPDGLPPNGADATDGVPPDEDLLDPVMEQGAGAAQIHFSGDSQTSQDSKGYSSISVREPLANLKARNGTAVTSGAGGMSVGRQRIGSSAASNRRRSSHRPSDASDPHYATVDVSDPDEDDSDEMYAAIAELQPIYDSHADGSDTYAKINDRSEAAAATSPPSGPVPSGSPGSAARFPVALVSPAVVTSSSSPPPAEPQRPAGSSSPVPPTPPSVVSLKQLSSSGSSRLHASSLSIASTASNVGSPKPEKRQANSPLPPPPQVDGFLHAGDSSERSSRKSMNVDEMYAKVTKKRGMTMPHPWQTTSTKGEDQHHHHHLPVKHRGSVDLGFLSTSHTARPESDVERTSPAFSPDNSRRNSVDATPPIRVGLDLNESLPLDVTIREGAVAFVDDEEEEEDDEDLRYEVLPAVTRPAVARPPRTISESDPGYEKIQLKSEESFSDPRYERIQLIRRPGGIQSEPNYEIVGFRRSEIKESNEPGYEEVEGPLQSFDRRDPNYESLHYNGVHQFREPPYATVDRAEDPPEDAGRDPVPQASSRPQEPPSNENNNTVGTAIYAQVVKPKKTTGAVLVTSPVVHEEDQIPIEEEVGEDQAVQTTSRTVVDLSSHQDFSVSSSRNTTIIRITDSRPAAFHFFSSDDDTFGVPEQV